MSTIANSYRPEVDGLRTISVLSVLLYHYKLGPLPGGFIGVDVFFVISGYLITSIIFAEMQAGTFSILGFYDRRVRRILPAVLATILATGAAGYLILLPGDYANFGRSAAASALGLANFHFLWSSGGYFDTAADLMPLLHMWSLGVEEQFYIIWPILLAVVFALSKGSSRTAALTLAIIIAASFTASVFVTKDDGQVAFYMLHTRAWELALGAILVFAPQIRDRAMAESAPVLGLAVIGYSIFFLNSNMPFPGWNALYPCIGAALIIWPKSFRPVGEVPLSVKPVAFIGKISFSLYLWHWPVLVLYRHLGATEMPPVLDRVFLACLTFALAAASWKFVEKPFRSWRPSYRLSVSAGALSTALVAAATFLITYLDGIPQRLPPQARKHESYRHASLAVDPACFVTSKSPGGYDRAKCIKPNDGRTRALLIGDSHAAQYLSAFEKEFPSVSFSLVSGSACIPILPIQEDSRCGRTLLPAFSEYLQQDRFDIVILAGRWKRAPSDKALENTISAIRPYASRVLILGPTVEYKAPLPVLLARSEILEDGAILLKHNLRTAHRRDKSWRELSRSSGAEFISLLPVQCPHDECIATTKGVPLKFDGNHLTEAGASFLLRRLKNSGSLKL